MRKMRLQYEKGRKQRAELIQVAQVIDQSGDRADWNPSADEIQAKPCQREDVDMENLKGKDLGDLSSKLWHIVA